jgi:hypothetical protein
VLAKYSNYSQQSHPLLVVTNQLDFIDQALNCNIRPYLGLFSFDKLTAEKEAVFVD